VTAGEAEGTAEKIDVELEDKDRRGRIGTKADMASWVGQPAIKGSTEPMRMALLTFSLIGLQYVFSAVGGTESLLISRIGLLGELN